MTKFSVACPPGYYQGLDEVRGEIVIETDAVPAKEMALPEFQFSVVSVPDGVRKPGDFEAWLRGRYLWKIARMIKTGDSKSTKTLS